MTLPDFYQQDLDRLTKADRLRTLALPSGHDFASNDYLALAGSEALRGAAIAALERGVPLGSGGSRLLRGNGTEHEALESEAARLFGAGSALYVSSGFTANSLLFATLPQSQDLILYDALVHASAHEGIRLSRAPTRPFAHNDVTAAADAIAQWRKEGGRGTVWIAFETLYSMDGDVAPVADFAALAEREGVMLLIDEAHAIGVCGPRGRGLAVELQGRENTITLATCGKALGCEGALILGPAVVREFLINRGRSFIFSTAPSPLMAAVVRAALGVIGNEDGRRATLQGLIRCAAEAFAPLGITASGSHIQPIILGEDARAMGIAAALQARGFDIRGIRPPTVPAGTARLRVSVTLNSDEAAIRALADALKELL